MTRMRMLGTSALLAVLVGTMSGCGGDSDRPKYREVTGKITAIDPETGVVSMDYNDKHGDLETLSGRLAPNAEIMIDGVTALKEDLKVGDSVTVTGRVEQYDDDRQLVATRVSVTRPDSTSSEATPSPARNSESILPAPPASSVHE